MANNLLTKTAIASCMKELMETKSFNKISVSDICRVCQINRKTFYYHFADKYELLNWIFQTDVVNPVIKKWGTFGNFEAAEYFLQYMYDHQTFYTKAFELTGPHSLRDYLSTVLQPTIISAFGDDFDGDAYPFSDALADFIVSALLRWLSHYPVAPPDEFFQQLIGVGTMLSIRLAELLHFPGK